MKFNFFLNFHIYSNQKEFEFASRMEDMKKTIFQRMQAKEETLNKEKEQEIKDSLKKVRG